MAKLKYNLKIQCKIKEGRMKRAPFVIGFFGDDAESIVAADTLEGLLGNNAKVGVSKDVRQVGNEELLDPENATDVKDVKVLARYQGTNPDDRSELTTVILPGISPEATETQITDFVKTLWVEAFDGNARKINQIISISSTPVNIKVGGMTNEQLGRIDIG